MAKITYARLSDILSSLDPQPYSGRGMNGLQCLSVITADGQDLLSLLADVAECCDGEVEAASVIRWAKTDNMGLGTILYWPSGRSDPTRTPAPADAGEGA